MEYGKFLFKTAQIHPAKMEDVLDWRYPQFMMTGQKLRELFEEQDREGPKDYDFVFDEKRKEMLIVPKAPASTN